MIQIEPPMTRKTTKVRAFEARNHQAKPSVARRTGATTTSMISVA